MKLNTSRHWMLKEEPNWMLLFSLEPTNQSNESAISPFHLGVRQRALYLNKIEASFTNLFAADTKGVWLPIKARKERARQDKGTEGNELTRATS